MASDIIEHWASA